MKKDNDFKLNFASPEWRLSHLYKIVNKDSSLTKFTPNFMQQQVNRSPAKRKLILKARQIGITTNEVLKDLDFTMWNRHKTTVIMAHDGDAIKKIFRIAKRAYNFMPAQLRAPLDRGGGSLYQMFFPKISSLIYCDLYSRGDTINRLHVSEVSRVTDERFIATMQAVPKDGEVVLETTAFGMNNFFYELWMERDSPYEKFFFPWFFASEYRLADSKPIHMTTEETSFCDMAKRQYGIAIDEEQLRFRRQKKIELKEYFVQEYPEDDVSCFLTTGQSCVNQVIVKTLLEKIQKPVLEKDSTKIFELPTIRDSYVIGADTAQGIGRDFCVAIVFSITQKKEVAMLRGHWSPFKFAKKLKELCDFFSKGDKIPLLAIERNNHGHAVIQELNEHIHYSNLFEDGDGKLGWNTNSVSRPIMLNQFITAVEEETIHLNSEVALRELMTLVNVSGKIEAASGKYDDCVIAGAIALQVLVREAQSISTWESINEAILV